MTTLTPTTAPAIIKEVIYDRESKDYAAYVTIDGGPRQCIGYGKTHTEADNLCNDYAYNFYADNHTPETAVQFLDDDPFNDGPSQEEQAASTAAWSPCEGGWEQYTPHPFDPSRTVRLFQPHI